MEEVSEKPEKKHLAATIVVVLIFLILGLFAIRVLLLYNQMLKGGGDESWLDYDTEMTISQAVGTSVANGSGEADVETEDDPSIGSHEAVLTIVEFGDFGCPYCGRASYSVRRLASKYGDQVRVIYRDFPVTDIHPQAQLAAEAAECAHEQGKFWEYHDKLFQNQDDFDYEDLGNYARQVGLDVDSFADCLAEERYRDEVTEDFAAGVAAGVKGTPTFFFNGTRVQGAIPDELFEMIVEAYLDSQEDTL